MKKRICKGCNKEVNMGHNCLKLRELYKKQLQDNKENIINLYKNGQCVNDICKLLKIDCNNKIYKLLQDNNIERRHGFQSEVTKEKYINTIKEKYGDKYINSSQVPKIKRKIRNTNIKKYGNDNLYKTQYFKDLTWIKYGRYPLENSQNKKDFYKKVQQLTNKNKKILSQQLQENNFKCYYTNAIIHLNNDYNGQYFACIDHKTSARDAFELGWTAEKTASLDNLCYCSRLANSVKQSMSEDEFLKSDRFKRLIEYENKKNNQTK